jgi:hypothetical protein
MFLPPRRRARPPPYTGKVLRERAPSWYHGVSPAPASGAAGLAHGRVEEAGGSRADRGVRLANLRHRRVVPLMERPLRIFEMTEAADPVAMTRSRLLPDLVPRAFAATRARRAIDTRSGRCDDMALWAFEMLPTGPLVSGVLDFISCLAGFSSCRRILSLHLTPADGEPKRCEVRPAHAPVPRARARGATARAGAGGTQEGA